MTLHTDDEVVMASTIEMMQLTRRLGDGGHQTAMTEGGGDSLTLMGWGSAQDIHFLFFLLFVFFGLFFMGSRLACLYRQRAQESGDFQGGTEENGGPDSSGRRSRRQPRTQDFIEQLLVLKKVFWIPLPEEEEEIEQPEKQPCKTHRRKKSNLVFVMGKDDEYNLQTCPICLCDYENGEDICWSKNESCSHHFHAACGFAWLAKHSECPVCRADYLIQSSVDEKPVDPPSSEQVASAEVDLEVGLQEASVDLDSSLTMPDIPEEDEEREAEPYSTTADIQLSSIEEGGDERHDIESELPAQ